MNLKLYDYLCNKRKINIDIINILIQEKKIYEDNKGNIVFVGYDEIGIPRYAALRGTHGNFRGDCSGSDKRYSFNIIADVPSDQLYIFESAIDLMSHASLVNDFKNDSRAWKRSHRISLSGTTDKAIPFFLNQYKVIKELVFCLDNDNPGHVASKLLSNKYYDKGYSIRIEPPYRKDFNEDLIDSITQKNKEKESLKKAPKIEGLQI
jgi:hypothetical protein